MTQKTLIVDANNLLQFNEDRLTYTDNAKALVEEIRKAQEHKVRVIHVIEGMGNEAKARKSIKNVFGENAKIIVANRDERMDKDFIPKLRKKTSFTKKRTMFVSAIKTICENAVAKSVASVLVLSGGIEEQGNLQKAKKELNDFYCA